MSQNPRVEADLASMDFRSPILEDPSLAELSNNNIGLHGQRQTVLDRESHKLDRRWTIATEAARRAILGESEVGAIATKYIAVPLDEQLPGAFLHAAQDADDAMSKETKNGGNLLPDYLGLPSVPAELMPIDISSSSPHHGREEAQASLQYDLEHYPVLYGKSVDSTKQWASEHGITQSEKQLVAKRYKYGRDVKLLGLLAELKDMTPQLKEEEGVLKAQLASGIRIGVAKEALESDSKLLDPREWKSRRQIKDRVYEVMIGDKAYILKEKKTNRHTDTTHVQGQGHEDGLSSYDEFMVGRKMAGNGGRSQQGVELEWEKPLAYAEFPNGYQFALFHKIEGLTARSGALEQSLNYLILGAPEAYESDYQSVKVAARSVLEEQATVLRDRRPGYTAPTDELDFDDYARAKANAMVCLAESLVKESAFDAGFWNQDHDRRVDFGMTIVRSDDGTHMLKAQGFDYEYFKNNPVLVENQKEAYERRKQDGSLMKEGAEYHGGPSIQQAAEYVLMNRYGWKIPSL